MMDRPRLTAINDVPRRGVDGYSYRLAPEGPDFGADFEAVCFLIFLVLLIFCFSGKRFIS